MSATDELLVLLTVHGLEHYEHEAPAEDCIAFFDGNIWHDCWESVDGEVNVTFSMTPQEAIAATVGLEPDNTAMLKLHDRMNAALLEFERAMGIEKADGAIAVPFVAEIHNLLEEAATVVRGTCHKVLNFDGTAWICSECGEHIGPRRWNYCPNCGRKVVDE